MVDKSKALQMRGEGKTLQEKCKINDEYCRGRIEAHHHLGYEKENWLKIEWYCSYHHRHIDGITWGKRTKTATCIG